MPNPRQALLGAFQAAVLAAQPSHIVPQFVPTASTGRIVVVGAGKAAAQMARSLEDSLGRPLVGIVVTQYGSGVECRGIKVIEAAHPVPEVAGLSASKAMLAMVRGLKHDDLVIALISGGGSALLPAPLPGLSLSDEIEVNRRLLQFGAPISVMNNIRSYISSIKGGRLALAARPARVVSLVLFDVPGDNPEEVASGPTVPRCHDLGVVLRQINDYRIELPGSVLDVMKLPSSTPPRPNHPAFFRNEVHVIGSARQSLLAAKGHLSDIGLQSVILADDIEGEAIDIARAHGAIARQIARYGAPFAKPIVLLSGGETTVTHSGGGKGGRNSEFGLAFALEIARFDNIFLLAADTDGRDGSECNAGVLLMA